jgi:hypothetical protein
MAGCILDLFSGLASSPRSNFPFPSQCLHPGTFSSITVVIAPLYWMCSFTCLPSILLQPCCKFTFSVVLHQFLVVVKSLLPLAPQMTHELFRISCMCTFLCLLVDEYAVMLHTSSNFFFLLLQVATLQLIDMLPMMDL